MYECRFTVFQNEKETTLLLKCILDMFSLIIGRINVNFVRLQIHSTIQLTKNWAVIATPLLKGTLFARILVYL